MTAESAGGPPTDLDRAYSPSRLVPDADAIIRSYGTRSEEAREALDWQELAYGPGAQERILYFPAGAPTNGPRPRLHVFVHGGYWHALSAAESCFLAPGLVAQGVAFAALGYGLAPDHTLDEVVDAVRRGALWLHRRAGDLGVGTDGLVLSGMSAGAHLVATCLLGGWLPDGLLPTDVVRGAALLSGLYELEPLRHTYVNEAVGMTPAQVERHSPARHTHPHMPPLVVARGADEPEAFGWQQETFVAAARDRGVPVEDLVVRGRNHFDLPFDLADPTTAVGHAVRAVTLPRPP